MPYNCCVPQCKSTSKIKGLMLHKFPKDKKLIKTWLVKIKSKKQPTKHTNICSKHFINTDYKVTAEGQWKILNYRSAVPSKFLPVRKFERSKVLTERTLRTSRRASNNCNAALLGGSENVGEIAYEKPLVTVDLNIAGVEIPNFIETSCVSVQTIVSLKRSQLISVTFMNEKQLQHMSGCSLKLFNFLAEYFGNSYTNVSYAISSNDELLLTLMKYKLNLYYQTLATAFDIDSRVVKRIVSKWSKHLYLQFKKINFCGCRNVRAEQYSILLDCTEFRAQKSADPIIQQATYSSYYGTNTFKALVGCTEDGMIAFVSDLYGGSISDRQITENSGILDLLVDGDRLKHSPDGDYVLADRGFDISDLLEEKGVCLNIPPFKGGNQLSEDDVAKTRAIANRRIIIENMIGAANINKILQDRMPSHL